ncbi:hypothetical protein V6N12_049145 [Hibiscus sabdariffa]|uniref:Uncharacterized protein n=1 Tax=Hibiscus sabdariffa TaxID=183260 RepID=A0ABR2EJD5_9ROSI
MAGRDSCSSAESRDEAGKGQNAFVVCAGSCQLFSQNFPHIDAITSHDCVDEQQPRPVHDLVMRCGHDIALHKCVP